VSESSIRRSSVWHEGLTRDAYGRWNEAQLRTEWGRAHLHRLALVNDAGDVLASAKRYRLDVRLRGTNGWMCGIGAVFTPPDHRGRGYASRLLEMMCDDARQDGALIAALFSEIGTSLLRAARFRGGPARRSDRRREAQGRRAGDARARR
jgi:GNAT superfamily N-acetyltransferase